MEETRACPPKASSRRSGPFRKSYVEFPGNGDSNCRGPATRLDETNISAPRPTPIETKCSLPWGPPRQQCLPNGVPTRYILPKVFLRDFGNASIFSADSPRRANDLLSDEDGADVGSWRGRFLTSHTTDLFTWYRRLSTYDQPTAQKLVTNLLLIAERQIE